MADGKKIILLTGTKKGSAGDVITVSSDVADAEILAGKAALAEAGPGTASSASTPGVAGQVMYDASFIYICTTGGLAGHATWKKATLASA